jgi:hypothetical protein
VALAARLLGQGASDVGLAAAGRHGRRRCRRRSPCGAPYARQSTMR